MTAGVQPIAPESVTYQGRDFTEAEAVAIPHSIKAYAKQTCFKLADAHDGRAYLAMGYDTFEAYCTAELDISRSRGYQLLRHAAAMREIGEAAGIDPVSTNVDTTEGQTRAIDTTAVAGAVAERVAAEPEADEARRAEIVDEVIEEHRVVTKRTTTIDPETGEILTDEPTGETPQSNDEGPSSNAPASPPGPVEQDDDAAHDAEGVVGSPAGGAGAAPEGVEAGGSGLGPSENEKGEDPPAAQDSPELLRAKAVKRHGDLMKQARHGLLMLSPIDVAAHCPAQDRDDWLAFAGQLADFAERLATEFTPTLRSVK